MGGSPELKKEEAGETSKSEGTFQYCNGDVYIGQWKEGKKHGSGTYACAADGTKLKGEWAKGQIQSGQWIFQNGAFFSGKFRYNKPLGKGVWVFPNGNQLMGEYKQKELVGDEEAPAEEDNEGAEKKDRGREHICVWQLCSCAGRRATKQREVYANESLNVVRFTSNLLSHSNSDLSHNRLNRDICLCSLGVVCLSRCALHSLALATSACSDTVRIFCTACSVRFPCLPALSWYCTKSSIFYM